MKKALLVTGIVILSIILLIGTAVGVLALVMHFEEIGMNNWYVTSDTSNYLKITHNNDNDIPQEFIKRFFPKELDSSFTEVKYMYQARKYCDYCCEAWLAITIEDPAAFNAYVASIDAAYSARPFYYDNQYVEYIISDKITLEEDRYDEEKGHNISGVEMGRILVNADTSCVIYSAICITHCCGDYTNKIQFFSEFDIEPVEYVKAIQ